MTPAAPACLAALLAGAAAAGEVRLDQSFASDALGRAMTYNVYLPDAAAAPGARLPVVYLLHGFGAGRAQWIDGAGLPASLDAMIVTGEIAPFIAVAPDAGDSWYVDSAARGGAGNLETAIARDLVAEIDARFPTDPRPEARAITGLSMGGFGALRLGFRHPETYGAIAALSPGIWKPGGMSWDYGEFDGPKDELATWYGGMTGPEFDVEVFAAMSPFADLERLAAMPAPPEILITVGDDDYFQLYDGALEMFLDLRALGLKPELRVADGGHDWAHWEPMSHEAFRFLDRAFRSEAPARR